MESGRKLVVTENITLDGVIDAAEGWFDPAGDAADTSDVVAVLKQAMLEQDALLLGRKRFEDMRGYWPHRTDDATGITDHLNRVSKYVFSSTLQDPQWQNTTVLRSPVRDAVRELLIDTTPFRSGIGLLRYRAA
jgi:dihydrofolate reductase